MKHSPPLSWTMNVRPLHERRRCARRSRQAGHVVSAAGQALCWHACCVPESLCGLAVFRWPGGFPLAWRFSATPPGQG